MPLIFDVSTTNSPGFLAGSGRHSMPSNTLKMAVFAPMPRPSASTATSVNPGLFTSTWKAYRRSLRSVSNETTLLAGPRFGTLTVRQARTLDRPNLAAMNARGRLSCYTQPPYKLFRGIRPRVYVPSQAYVQRLQGAG